MNKISETLLISCPNGGGVFLCHKGHVYHLDDFDTTGLFYGYGKLLRGLQPNDLSVYDEQENIVISGIGCFDDIHDVLYDGHSIYLVGSAGNEIVELNQSGDEIRRWVFPGENDALHINCIANWNGRIVFSAFGDFKTHRGYKGQTEQSGFVQDLLSNDRLINGLSQPHSLVPLGENLLVANSETMQLLEFSPKGEMLRSKQLDGYTRGVSVGEHAIYVGLSRSRNIETSAITSAAIVEIDRDTLEEVSRVFIPVDEVYGIQLLKDSDNVTGIVSLISSEAKNKYKKILHQKIVEIASLTQALIDRDAQIGERSQAVMERDEQIVGLNQALAERDGQITGLNQALSEKEGQGIALNASIEQRDEQIESLNKAVAEVSIQHKLIQQSHSWRITAPLRFATRFKQYGLVFDDRIWFENKVRHAFRKLPFSIKSKMVMRNCYVNFIGLLTRDTRPSLDFSRQPESATKNWEQSDDIINEKDSSGFLAPEHWEHNKTPYSLLILPIIDWHFRFQRPQQIARRFAIEKHFVAYASLQFGPEMATKNIENNIDELRLPGLKSANVYKELPREEDVEQIVEALRHYTSQFQAHRPWVCVVQLPYWGRIAERLRELTGFPIIYDCMDDHKGFSTNGEQMLVAEERLLCKADLVVASSSLLFEKVLPIAKHSVLIRNAADYNHFAGVPKTLHSYGSTITIGYYGAIADWFDSALMAEVAKLRPSWKIILIGSTFSADTGPLIKCENISLEGEMPYIELPQLIAKWDCCVIPFKRLPLTEATNPVKIYEMLAAGKPVVSVSLPELRPIADAGHISLADSVVEFVRKIENEVDQDTESKQMARRLYASENTWDSRYAELNKAITLLYPMVSIVVVTYNNEALNRLCLESLFNDTDYPNYEIIVVDNASTDGTIGYLQNLRHPMLTVILNNENRGFAAANNQGLELARGEFLCLLNNDTIVAGSWLSTMVQYLRGNPKIGLIGPVTNAIGNEAKIPVGYHNLLDMPAWSAAYCQSQHGCLEDITMLAFFCVVMPRSVFEIVGKLDERFGIGMFEDDDYNRRVREAGYQVVLAKDAYIHHWQRASFKLLGERKYFEIFYENERKYQSKLAMDALNKRQVEEFAGLVKASSASHRTFIFAPSIGWNVSLFQRPQHLARVFAQEGYTVVFDCSNNRDDVDFLEEIEPKLFLFSGEPGLLSSLKNLVVWTFTYNYEYRDCFGQNVQVVYDWIDDLEVFPYDKAMLAKLHSRAIKEADIVSCVARRLLDNATASRLDALYLPNAVEAGRFDPSSNLTYPEGDNDFKLIVNSGKLIAGYYGALAHWFDYDLLIKTASLCPNWHFVLIGPNHDGSMDKFNLKKHRNISWLGPRDYELLPGYLHHFDVAMIPFKINDITLATSPLKLFEYFAGGKPVVSTHMPECAAFEEVTVIANAEEFAAGLDFARTSSRTIDYQRRLATLSKENTWRARAALVLKELDDIDDKRHSILNSEWALLQKNISAVNELQNSRNKSFFLALKEHLHSLANDPSYLMYFQFALSANDRGRSVVDILSRRMKLEGKRHLDVGCAYGGFVVAFSEQGADSVGFDIDPILLGLAKLNFKDQGREFRVALKDVTQWADVSEFSKSFDIITCNDVIEHVSDPEMTIKNISLMLDDGGIAYFEIPNRDASEFVHRDGHYSLFGITQLEHEDASKYYECHAPGTPYTVGHYLRLHEYKLLFHKVGLDMEVLNESLIGTSVSSTIDSLHQIEQAFAVNLTTVPEQLREQVNEKVRAYITRARIASDNTSDAGQDFLLTYGACFWKILVRKL